MIAFAYTLGLMTIVVSALVFWGGFAEERRATRLPQI